MKLLLFSLVCFTLAEYSLSWLHTFKVKYGKVSEISVDTNTNSVYVGGVNGIYHLDSQLKEKQSLQLKQSTVTVLEIEPTSKYLLACGTVRQGACTIHQLQDISKQTSTYDTKAENLIGSKKSVYAFFEESPKNVPFMYVAMAYDGRISSKYPFALSERKIVKSNSNYKISYRNSFDYITANQSYPTEFIYGFKHDNFIYYVSVRSNNSTYLLRVCEDDDSYYYIDLNIYCWAHDFKLHYSTAARFTYIQEIPVLIVVFWSEERKASAICHYQMRFIKQLMMKQIENCANYVNGVSQHASWVVTTKDCTEVAHSTITVDTCGIADNLYSSIKDPSAASSKVVLQTYITALQLYTLDHATLYLLGTKDGHLLKIRLKNPNHMVMDYDVSEGKGEPIERDMELVGNKTAYVLSGSKIFPKSGPSEGNTLLTIKGDYFKNKNDMNSDIEVVIKDTICTVQEYDETTIKCLTDKQKDKKGSVHITVKSFSNDKSQPDINGQNTSKEFFYFFNPQIFDFTPKFGPKSGGTLCTITGTKLDIGSSATVMMGSSNFTIINRTDSEIIAKTPWINFPNTKRVKVIIDGKIMSFSDVYNYTEDPMISKVAPQNSIQSGGITIQFEGNNLNTVMNPRLSGKTVESEQELSIEACQSNQKGTRLNCPSPTIKGRKIKKLVSVDIHLLMDGVASLYNLSKTNSLMSRFHYFPDPVLEKFPGDNNVFKYSKSTKEIEIKGDDIMHAAHPKDINITIDRRIPCKITKLTMTSIKCEPESMPFRNITKNFKLEVKVQVGHFIFNPGWLLHVEPESIFASATVIILIVILTVILFFIILTCYCLWKKKAFPKRRQIPHSARYFNGGEVSLDVFGRLLPTTTNEYTERQDSPATPTYVTGATSGIPLIDEDTYLLLKDQKLLIPKEALLMKDKIGQGHFGCVHRAFLFKPGEKGESLVAVKTLHKDNPREIDVKAFLTEAIIMKDFDHENILSLIGICLGKDQMPLVVLPYMLHGDLLSYLRDVNNQPTIKDLIVFGISIASGMDYLSGLKFVHRDLAARNCMLDENLVVKVADFGLSRDIYERDYYSSDNKKSKLPVKWMALESLETGNYNIKTDVWSYGVVLWELFTRGVNPYPTVDNWDMPKFLKSGRRMEKPDYCPCKTYEIMLRCWQVDQNLRPDFATIVEELTELSQMEKHGDIPINQIMYYENVTFALNNNIKPTFV
ncbi:hepatocyte growth factor receptor-like [Argonauta hians]